MLLKPGMEAHSYEPTPRDIIRITESDLFLYAGGESDVWVEELLEGKADLSGITNERVSLSSVKQESHVEVDENGCKATAYTKMDIVRMSMPVPMEQYDFSLDRPFLFVIESQDEAPLFVGTVYNPLQ